MRVLLVNYGRWEQCCGLVMKPLNSSLAFSSTLNTWKIHSTMYLKVLLKTSVSRERSKLRVLWIFCPKNTVSRSLSRAPCKFKSTVKGIAHLKYTLEVVYNQEVSKALLDGHVSRLGSSKWVRRWKLLGLVKNLSSLHLSVHQKFQDYNTRTKLCLAFLCVSTTRKLTERHRYNPQVHLGREGNISYERKLCLYKNTRAN